MNVQFRQPIASILILFVLAVSAVLAPRPAQAEMALRQAIAEAVAEDAALADFYRARGFAPIWTGPSDDQRRAALLEALDGAADHGLPVRRYDAQVLRDAFRAASDADGLGRVEALAGRMYLDYARDVQSGMLEPGRILRDIHKTLPRRDPALLLAEVTQGNPHDVMRALPPDHPEYTRLMREKLRLERLNGMGGWGPEVPAGRLAPGDAGPGVIALRERLRAMGYPTQKGSGESDPALFDPALDETVRRFQGDHGLAVDGIVGPQTLGQLNTGIEDRLGQIMLAMERQRWMNIARGGRHIIVNIPEFMAYVIDDEAVTFETRVVVGHPDRDRRTPEFSDMMEHMVINPTWYVPRSITVGEYLPQLQRNPNAAAQLRLFTAGGQPVNRANVDFTRYDARSFPFSMRQPPSDDNALGLVKFMFPNQWNIYLHDTPARNLFSRTRRAYSHGCVRVARPFELAYHLLAPQQADPEAFFQGHLRSRRETYVTLEEHVPVHLVYWTAWVTPEGRAQYRPDIYGRNAALWAAMLEAGVAVRAVSS